MNAMPERDVFDSPTHVIVGGTAKTGSKQEELLLQGGEVNLVSTGSSLSTYNFGAGEGTVIKDENTGLPLNKPDVIFSSIKGEPGKAEVTSYKRGVGSNQHQDKMVPNETEITPRKIGIADVAADILTFGQPVHLTCHAMAMSKIDPNYPAEVVAALEHANAQVADVIYISYEAGFDEAENPKGSHVYYPARSMKDDMEASTLSTSLDDGHISYEALEGTALKVRNGDVIPVDTDGTGAEVKINYVEKMRRAKVVDLITFDSPSAKALGFTFLGIVGDFVNFIEESPWNPIAQKFEEILKDFLEEDYEGIIEMFRQYPIRGELIQGIGGRIHNMINNQTALQILTKLGVKKGQQSMRDLAENGEYFSMISGQTKKIDFAKFSRISGVITDLYLFLAMNDLNVNRDDILSQQGDRVLLDWHRVAGQDLSDISDKIDSFVAELGAMTNYLGPTQELRTQNFPQNTIYHEVHSGENERRYELDVLNLGFLSHHFGILPLFMMQEMVRNTGLLGDSEFIELSRPESMIYAYNKVTIIREGNKVILRSTDDSKETFCEFTIGNTAKMNKPDTGNSRYYIPESEKQKTIEETSFPHSLEYGMSFLHSLPNEFKGVSFSRRSALVEHLAFQAANLFLNNPNPKIMDELQEVFDMKTRVKPHLIQGKFSKIQAIYEDPNLDDLLDEGPIPTPVITKASYKWGKISIDMEVEDDLGDVIAKYQFVFD